VGDPGLDNVARLFAPGELHAMLRECHYVVLSAPLTPETHHLIGPAEFAVMKPEVVLINVARGGLVDEAALVEALQSGRIAGAALDVFDREPLPAASPLWGLPNVHLSPHISDVNTHYIERAMELFAENLRRYLAGEPLANVVDVVRGY
jgi:phosphoglycerate dehydrogenase-like enzyme